MHWVYFNSNYWPSQLPAVSLWPCSFCHTVPVARLLGVVCSVCVCVCARVRARVCYYV